MKRPLLPSRNSFTSSAEPLSCPNLGGTRRVSLRNGRMLLTEASRLFERVRHLQDAEVLLVAAHDLHAHWKSLWRETARHGSRWIARCRDIPAGLHPIDVVIEFHAGDLGWIRHVDVKCRPLCGGQNEVFVLFEECLKPPPTLAVGALRARYIHTCQPQPLFHSHL